jgi:hypothetical protein
MDIDKEIDMDMDIDKEFDMDMDWWWSNIVVGFRLYWAKEATIFHLGQILTLSLMG